ncbi:cyclic peptide export ABC transporter [Chitinophaga rhizophila]|uniref:Cyclic peptide export ABC transporter n=1 Tax=Chitinophaga rhizophila TaxID=2866212 RepID=A0ABS7G6L9_9BACT|nr:cyclic peptide export ABC transporter [Chitinophaga rhizophila]MBW8683026.1 cyclic peptide export ABC transporter [Chitinophaga rhizophila]
MIKVKSRQWLLIGIYALLNTACTVAILYIINMGIRGDRQFNTGSVGGIFFGIVIFSYLFNLFFQKYTVRYSYEFVYGTELRLAERIQQLTLHQQEAIGSERIYGVLEDLRVFIFMAGVVNNTLNSLLMILVSIMYLFYISLTGALITLLLIAGTALVYFIVGKQQAHRLNRLRNYNERFTKMVDDLLQGFKEFKISAGRRKNFRELHLSANRNEARELDVLLSGNFVGVNILSQYGLYLVFGAILFVFPLFGGMQSQQTGVFMVVLLFMSGPINRLISLQHLYTRMKVAARRVSGFFRELDSFLPEAPMQTAAAGTVNFETLEFRDCVWQHGEHFQLGPMNFRITKGEVVFIIGGNGSGKSTFIKLFTGLYTPVSGTILLNGRKVDSNTADYQDLLSVVFTDNYIFSCNYDDYILEDNPVYKKLLKTMELDHVIRDTMDESPRRRFSQGQRKRISLIFSLLEQHPLLVLDEWAADQDPYFRKYFYEQLLPALKQEGKTILAVTHDDAYFQYADRIVKFEHGNIISDIAVQEGAQNQKILWTN